MKSLLCASALSLSLAPAVANAEATVEVMHFWTTGGEASALATVREAVEAEGFGWVDAPIAGGGGDQAKTALQARVAAGDPPAAMLILGQNVLDWAREGLLGNVDDVASEQGWDAALPDAVKAFVTHDGHYVSAPTNVHRTDMMWVSRSALETIDAEVPTTWAEFNALAPRFREAGILPLAHGGQAWQEMYLFEAVAAGIGGADFYRSALVEQDDATLRGDTMLAVFEQFATLRDMVDENAPGRDWNLATAMVMNGEAAIQIMGDWAKGEFTNAGYSPDQDFICAPVPKAQGDAFVYLVNSLSLFEQQAPEQAEAQRVLARAIMSPDVQVAFNAAKGAIPARTDVDVSALDSCAQQTAAAMAATDASGDAVPTFAGTHAASAATVGAATDAVTEFFNTTMTPQDGVTLLADAIQFAN